METPPPLWKHQIDAIEKAKSRKTFALFHDMGTGKTRTILEILRYRYNVEKRVKKTIILAPLIALTNWKSEIEKYTKIPAHLVHIFEEGSIADKARMIARFQGIVILNYDVFVKEDFTKAVMAWKPEILIADECHRIKNIKSKRTKNLLKISVNMPPNSYRYIMTGSPITNTQMDLWSQFYFLDHGETFGDSFFGFRAAYFYNVNAMRPKDGRYFPLWVPKKGIEDAINKKVVFNSSIVKKSECLDLPPLIRREVEVPLSKEQRSLYEDMKKDFITYVNDKASVASIALTKLIRMQQIITGFLKMEDDTIERFDNPRARILGELLGDITDGSKTIVWAVQHEDYATIRRVCDERKILYVEAHGLVPKNDRDRFIEQFRSEEKVRVLIGSPAAIGIAINLVESDCSIWYSRNFSLEQDEQANARNYRGGSERHNKVTRIDLVAKGTLDEVVLRSLKEKKSLADGVLSKDFLTQI